VSSFEPIDLRHQATDRVIGVYLLETEDGPALFDCGPSTCIDRLKAGLAERGLALTEVRHLLLSHIHPDHAGAAGTLVREHPSLQAYVSEIGAPHLVDPSRLEGSARRLWGESFDVLWGSIEPVPVDNIREVGDRVVGLECFPTPGHASHHVSYLDGDGTLYAGDAVGVRIQPARHIMPQAPPPDVNLEAWSRTLDEIEMRAPDRLALIHFGVAEDPTDHLSRMRDELRLWAERVAEGMTEQEFVGACRAELETQVRADIEAYEKAAPLWQSYLGLKRYWDKRREAETALI
jgi:glyoxylase-like metal-dependent hydrolase (beta-lactamase superfamily II)